MYTKDPSVKTAEFNAAKPTTPGAPILALEALARARPERVHLIAGGYDKRIDLSPLAEAARRCAGVYTIGATGPALAASVDGAGGRAFACSTLDEAVGASIERMGPGDVLLLSPACASWDQFTNYIERGEAFKSALNRAVPIPISAGSETSAPGS